MLTFKGEYENVCRLELFQPASVIIVDSSFSKHNSYPYKIDICNTIWDGQEAYCKSMTLTYLFKVIRSNRHITYHVTDLTNEAFTMCACLQCILGCPIEY